MGKMVYKGGRKEFYQFIKQLGDKKLEGV